MTERQKPTPTGPWFGEHIAIKCLRRACDAAGGQNAWARRHHISRGHVSHVLAGRKTPGTKLTKALGLEMATMWRWPSRVGEQGDEK